MEALLISFSTVALAEMGDRTQLLVLLLATRFRRPWPIVAGVVCATLLSEAVAAALGAWIGTRLRTGILDTAVGASMIIMGLWMLKPDTLGERERVTDHRGIFLTTLGTFLLAELGDKTQIAALALAAAYHNLPAVIAGSSLGLLVCNIPVIFLGKLFAERLPLRAIRYASSALMIVLGAVFLVRALHH
ncbi:MAG TPA: TMEM165/GDT1 family protein [Steroidobacteraceae bacterium]|jgi:putative Ca2+/H+ antiporter (TMEM165/GDT1 family)|nr:TMEM165/GDT1 family protein [Steroidobacteraceae bacterium]